MIISAHNVLRTFNLLLGGLLLSSLLLSRVT